MIQCKATGDPSRPDKVALCIKNGKTAVKGTELRMRI